MAEPFTKDSEPPAEEWTPIRWARQWLGDRDRSDNDPITIARSACEAEEWPWLEPACVESTRRHWIVVTNTDQCGRNARIIINKLTGAIICKSFMRRASLLRGNTSAPLQQATRD